MKFFGIWVVLLLTTTVFSGDARKPFGELKEEQKFNDYTIRIYRNEDDNSEKVGFGCLVISKADKQVYFRDGFKFSFSDIFDEEHATNLPHISPPI